VREARAAEARTKFFCSRAAADDGTAFEYKRFESGFGQIESRDQAIVAAAEYDDIANFGHVFMGAKAPDFYMAGWMLA
jgi:hypothetical protein